MPTALKLLRGETRPSRVNYEEPQPDAARPPRPPHLTGMARAEWERLAELTEGMRVLTVADGPILEATALAYAEYRAALKASLRNPTYRTRTKAGGWMVRAHPAAAMAGDAWRRYVQGLGHLGLSPASRSKVSARPARGHDPDAQRFFGNVARYLPQRG